MQLLPAFTGENHIYHTDALSLMRSLGDKSVDAYITDLPYGTTACSWDEIIPFAPMWAEVKRTLKPRGVFVTTASQPFTSKLVMSNVGMFKYAWVWNKVQPVGHLNAKVMPLRVHEDVIVFAESTTNYYPQMLPRFTKRIDKRQTKHYAGNGYQAYGTYDKGGGEWDEYYPRSIIAYSNADQTDKVHPTQKPVTLYEYLISTYTRTGDLVVDFCCGSGTTCLAARNLERRFIAGDITPEYVEMARKRLSEAYTPIFPMLLEQVS